MIEKTNINGAELCLCTNEALHSFSLGVFIKGGSMYETAENNGISHFFEHLVFRNLNCIYKGNYYELAGENGITLYACTYNELIYFEISGLVENFDFAIETLFGIFSPFVLNSKELKAEKNRIRAEIREGDSRNSLDFFAQTKIWNETSLEQTIIGSCKNLDSFSIKKMNEFRKSILSSGNIYFCLTGNADEQCVSKLKACVSSLNISKEGLNRSNTVSVPEKFSNRDSKIFIKKSPWSYVRLCFDTDTTKYPFHLRHLVSSILFEGENSLIYLNLSEKKPLIYSYDYINEEYSNIGNIKLKFEIDNKNLETALTEAVDTFNSVKNGSFNLKSAKMNRKTCYMQLLDSPSSLNWNIGYLDFILGEKSILNFDEFIYLFDTVTEEQVISYAKEVFQSKNLVLALKGNYGQKRIERIKEIFINLDYPSKEVTL